MGHGTLGWSRVDLWGGRPSLAVLKSRLAKMQEALQESEAVPKPTGKPAVPEVARTLFALWHVLPPPFW